MYSHSMGTGTGPVQGPNEKYSMMWKFSEWFERGTGTETIVFYWSFP